MSILKRIKSVLGLNGSRRTAEDGPVAVTVEHEPATASTSPDAETSEAPPPVDTDPEPAPDDPTPVTEISGIGPSYGERLGDAGIETIGDLAAADAAAVAADTDLSETRVSGWISAARDRGSGD